MELRVLRVGTLDTAPALERLPTLPEAVEPRLRGAAVPRGEGDRVTDSASAEAGARARRDRAAPGEATLPLLPRLPLLPELPQLPLLQAACAPVAAIGPGDGVNGNVYHGLSAMWEITPPDAEVKMGPVAFPAEGPTASPEATWSFSRCTVCLANGGANTR